MLALAGAVLVAAVVLAAGAPERLGIGSTQLEGSSGPDVLVVTEGRLPANSRVYRVALKVISAGIAADPAVEEVRQASSPGSARAAALEVELAPADEGERQAAVTRITENMDPARSTSLSLGIRRPSARRVTSSEAICGDWSCSCCR